MCRVLCLYTTSCAHMLSSTRVSRCTSFPSTINVWRTISSVLFAFFASRVSFLCSLDHLWRSCVDCKIQNVFTMGCAFELASERARACVIFRRWVNIIKSENCCSLFTLMILLIWFSNIYRSGRVPPAIHSDTYAREMRTHLFSIITMFSTIIWTVIAVHFNDRIKFCGYFFHSSFVFSILFLAKIHNFSLLSCYCTTLAAFQLTAISILIVVRYAKKVI